MPTSNGDNAMYDLAAGKVVTIAAATVTTAAGVVGVLLAAAPEELLSAEHVEAWARFGVAGGCILLALVGMIFVLPRIHREHRQAQETICATHERTINRICDSHAASMQEIRESHREDGRELGGRMDRLATSIDAMREAYHEDSVLRLQGLEALRNKGNQQ